MRDGIKGKQNVGAKLGLYGSGREDEFASERVGYQGKVQPSLQASLTVESFCGFGCLGTVVIMSGRRFAVVCPYGHRLVRKAYQWLRLYSKLVGVEKERQT